MNPFEIEALSPAQRAGIYSVPRLTFSQESKRLLWDVAGQGLPFVFQKELDLPPSLAIPNQEETAYLSEMY